MTSALIVAAGRGTRMKSTLSKQYMTLDEVPIMAISMEKFLRHPKVDEVIAVISQDEEPIFREKVLCYLLAMIEMSVCPQKPIRIAYGGEHRTDSVRRGLLEIDPSSEVVLVHDAVRPFVREQDISAVIDGAMEYGACITGVYVRDTIKEIDEKGMVVSTPDRDRYFCAQTPQGFKREILEEAYQELQTKRQRHLITDDAMLAEISGYPVKTVLGSYGNTKITGPEDLIMAQARYQQENV